MHSFARHHSESGEASAKETKGLILNFGWRYDLMGWFCNGATLIVMPLHHSDLCGAWSRYWRWQCHVL
jgi:hypothetical protein